MVRNSFKVDIQELLNTCKLWNNKMLELVQVDNVPVHKQDEPVRVATVKTPYIGIDNDPIHVYVGKTRDKTYVMSDGGQTLRDLHEYGITDDMCLTSNMLNRIRLMYGVDYCNGSLITTCDKVHVGRCMANLLQGIMVMYGTLCTVDVNWDDTFDM